MPLLLPERFAKVCISSALRGAAGWNGTCDDLPGLELSAALAGAAVVCRPFMSSISLRLPHKVCHIHFLVDRHSKGSPREDEHQTGCMGICERVKVLIPAICTGDQLEWQQRGNIKWAAILRVSLMHNIYFWE